MQKSVIAVLLAAPVVLIALIWFLMSMSYTNQEVRLRNLVEQKQKACEVHFDNMWKSIAQVAQVPEAAKNSFREMYEPLISGRYGAEKGSPLMKWIQEQNPAFDWSLYSRVQTTIVAERESYMKSQEMLIDVNREHRNLLMTVPSKWFISADTIAIKIITSAKTEEAYSTGQENDISVFKVGR